MPSVAKGFSLDLVLAGSKVGIVDSSFSTTTKSHLSSSSNHLRPPVPPPQAPPCHHQHHYNNKGASLVYNYKKYEHAGVLDPSVLIKAGALSRHVNGTLHGQEGVENNPLPKLKYHQQTTRQLSGGGSGGSIRSGGQFAESPPIRETHYTHRQRFLLEHDSNQNISASGAILNQSELFHNKDLIQQQHPRLTGLNQKEDNGLMVGSHDSFNNGRTTLKSRPFSSQLEHGSISQGRQSGTTIVVQRHSSENLLTHSDQLLEGGRTTPRRTQSLHKNVAANSPSNSTKRHQPETLNWTLSPPNADLENNSINSDDDDEMLHGRPLSPSLTHTNNNLTPSPRYNLEEQENDPTPGEVQYNQEYLETVAKENRAIKKEVQKSLKRLLKRAVYSAGAVTKAEVQTLRNQLHNTTEARPSSRGRRGSGNSQDSGISSDSIAREANEYEAGRGISPRDAQNLRAGTHHKNMEDEDAKTHRNKKKRYAANKLKSKQKSRSSGKKSRQKSRPNSLKKAKDETNIGVTREGLNIQAYCQTMQVLPGSLRPKADKPQISLPAQPIRATTTAIYKERLPRVPQPTLTCDGSALKDKTIELAVTYPPNRRSLNLNATKISSYEGAPRKSQVYAGGAVADEAIRLTKVYLSERQSGVMNELGLEIPYAPPVTPMPEVLKRIEYIPSMFDIRAQRAVKSKLEVLDRQDKKKKEKQAVQQAKTDKAALKEQYKESKKQQRLQIYALNKVMTAWENKNFVEFCSVNGIDADL